MIEPKDPMDPELEKDFHDFKMNFLEFLNNPEGENRTRRMVASRAV